jgi:hypothetical protein
MLDGGDVRCLRIHAAMVARSIQAAFSWTCNRSVSMSAVAASQSPSATSTASRSRRVTVSWSLISLDHLLGGQAALSLDDRAVRHQLRNARGRGVAKGPETLCHLVDGSEQVLIVLLGSAGAGSRTAARPHSNETPGS